MHLSMKLQGYFKIPLWNDGGLYLPSCSTGFWKWPHINVMTARARSLKKAHDTVIVVIVWWELAATGCRVWNILEVKTNLKEKRFFRMSYGNSVSTGQTIGSAMDIKMSKAEASEEDNPRKLFPLLPGSSISCIPICCLSAHKCLLYVVKNSLGQFSSISVTICSNDDIQPVIQPGCLKENFSLWQDDKKRVTV